MVSRLSRLLLLTAFIGLIGYGANAHAATKFVAASLGDGNVEVYDEDGEPFGYYTPFPGFQGEVRTAIGFIGGVPYGVFGAGEGGSPRITIINLLTGGVLSSFFAYEPSFRDGVQVAVAQYASTFLVIAGAAAGGGPRVRVMTPTNDTTLNAVLPDFFAYESTFRGGVNVAAGDVLGVGHPQIIAGAGDGGGPRVKVYDLGDDPTAPFYIAVV